MISSRIDPTRSITLRRIFITALRMRYNVLRSNILRLLKEEDALGIKRQNRTTGVINYGRSGICDCRSVWGGNRDSLCLSCRKPTTNVRWRYETNPNKIKRFREWLRGQIDSTLAGDALIERYIEQSYRKGTARAYDDVTKGSPYSPTTKEDFLDLAFSSRATVEKVKLLASRTFSELDGINQRMSSAMSRLLAEGLAGNRSLEEIASRIAKEVGIAINRATTIARTEITRAHAEAQLDAMERLGVTHVGASVEWDTANDSKVCPLCKPLDGIVLKLKEARGMLPRHPNCRCAWIPVVHLGSTKKSERIEAIKRAGQKRNRRDVQRAIDKSRKKEQGSDWGPNEDISRRQK